MPVASLGATHANAHCCGHHEAVQALAAANAVLPDLCGSHLVQCLQQPCWKSDCGLQAHMPSVQSRARRGL